MGRARHVEVQILGDGGTELILPHLDAASGGGSFLIGTVISADMDLVGQLQPHQTSRFVPVDMAQALHARSEQTQRQAALAWPAMLGSGF